MTYVDSLTALADPTRRLVFEEVAQNPGPVSALAKKLPVSRPAVSQHLRVLSDAGLVQARAEGTRRIYSLRPDGLDDLRRWIDRYWDGVLSSFANEIKEGKEDA